MLAQLDRERHRHTAWREGGADVENDRVIRPVRMAALAQRIRERGLAAPRSRADDDHAGRETVGTGVQGLEAASLKDDRNGVRRERVLQYRLVERAPRERLDLRRILREPERRNGRELEPGGAAGVDPAVGQRRVVGFARNDLS